MRLIGAWSHSIIDYMIVILMLIGPSVWGFTGRQARFAYILAGALFVLTFLTRHPLGVIKIVRNGSVAGTFLDIRSLVKSGGEQGLLSLAFHPQYASNHRFYVNYTDTHGDTRVVEYRSSNGTAQASTARQILFVRLALQLTKTCLQGIHLRAGGGNIIGDGTTNARHFLVDLGLQIPKLGFGCDPLGMAGAITRRELGLVANRFGLLGAELNDKGRRHDLRNIGGVTALNECLYALVARRLRGEVEVLLLGAGVNPVDRYMAEGRVAPAGRLRARRTQRCSKICADWWSRRRWAIRCGRCGVEEPRQAGSGAVRDGHQIAKSSIPKLLARLVAISSTG